MTLRRARWQLGILLLLGGVTVVFLRLSGINGVMKSVSELGRDKPLDAGLTRSTLPSIKLPLWIESYVDFHHNTTSYLGGSYAVKIDPPTATLVYTCKEKRWCGGVGDRLNGILASLYMSICSNRTFLIDLASPDPIEMFLVPNRIYWNASKSPNTKYEIVKAVDKKAHRFAKDPSTIPKEWTNIALYANQWNLNQIRNSSCIQSFIGQSSEDADEIDNLYYHLFWTLFRWSDQVKERASELKMLSRITDGPQETIPANPYVAVHIRTGDSYFQYKGVRHNNSNDVQAFYECGRNIRKRLETCFQSQQQLGVYLASDNPQTIREYQALDQDNTTRRPPSLEIYHPDRDKRLNVTDRQLAHLDVWSELKILTDATCLVHSRSGFSEAAAWIGIQPRCAVRFDQCGEEHISKALTAVGCNTKC